MTIYTVKFGSEKYSDENHEFNVSARSITEAESKANKLADKNEVQKSGRYTRSVELLVETDN